MHVPSAHPFNVLYHDLKAIEVEGGDCIKADVEEHQGPFKEGVDGVS